MCPIENSTPALSSSSSASPPPSWRAPPPDRRSRRRVRPPPVSGGGLGTSRESRLRAIADPFDLLRDLSCFHFAETMAESIPEEVVVDILLRLPAKSLVRFKCVCKRWRSLISDRAFAKSHLQRLKAGDLIPSQRIIIGGPNSPLKTVDYEALDGGGEGRVVVPHGIKPLWESRIVGSCHGLVCLIDPSNFVIYNPTTREYIELPSPDFVDPATLFSRTRNGSFYGFGYDSQSDDYKIALGDVVGVENSKLAIFSLKYSSWRMIEVPFQEEEVELCGEGVYWKGALHWHVYMNDEGNVYDEGESAIMSFDLSEEKFHQVLPFPLVDEDIQLLGLQIHGANLFIFKGARDHCIEAWITDDYGIGAPWAEWFSIDCSAFINCNMLFGMIPLAYTRSGKFVFWMDRKRMILFNPEDNTYKDYHLGMDRVTEYAIYLETLVSPYLGGGAVE